MITEDMKAFFEDAVNNKIKGLEQQIKNRDCKIKMLENEIDELRKVGKRIITSSHDFRLKLEAFMEDNIWDLPYKDKDCPWESSYFADGMIFFSERSK